MKTAKEIVEWWKIAVLPQGSEDWAIIAEGAAKEYAKSVVQEIIDNSEEYFKEKAGLAGIWLAPTAKLEQLIKELK